MEHDDSFGLGLGTLEVKIYEMPMKIRLALALLVLLAGASCKPPQTSQTAPATGGSSSDYATEVVKMIDAVAEADAQGDMTMRPYYEEAILGLDAYCSENVGLVVRMAAEEVNRQGNLDEQFSLLNELEETLSLAEDAPARPAICEALIGQ